MARLDEPVDPHPGPPTPLPTHTPLPSTCQVAGGQIDSLSTLPGVRPAHAAAAWLACAAAWTFLNFLCCAAYFLAVLRHSTALVPAVNLFLCGLALGPLAMALGCVVTRADALVVAVPTAVFVFMLPGEGRGVRGEW